MPEPCTHQHQRAVAVWETTHSMGTSPDLAVDPLNSVVGADTQPMLRRVVRIGQRFGDTLLQRFCRTSELGFSHILNNFLCFAQTGSLIFLRKDRLEHRSDFIGAYSGYLA